MGGPLTYVQVGAALAALGCSSEPVVELGVGTSWAPIASGETVELVIGPQGGRHILGNARLENLDPGNDHEDAPIAAFRVFDEEGAQWDADLPGYPEPFVEIEGGGHALPAGRHVLLVHGSPVALDQARIEFRVEITDAHGRTASDSRWVRVHTVWPAAPE
jgi:hypothetical protein